MYLSYASHFALPVPTALWSSYFGGQGHDFAGGITATSQRVYIHGKTHSLLDFPTNAPTITGHIPYLQDVPQSVGTSGDGFIAQLKHDVTIGIGESAASNAADLVIFPNPAIHELVIIVPKEQGASRIELINDLGQIIRSFDPGIGLSRVTLSISDLAAGGYTIIYRTSENNLFGRFIKH